MFIAQKNKISGFSIVEILVAVTIITLVGLAVTASWRHFIRLTQVSADLTQAALLTEEASEALLIFRDRSWSGLIAPLTLGVPYYIGWDDSTYSTSTDIIPIADKYSVSFLIDSVMRDTNGNIINSGGTIDVNTVSTTISINRLDSASPSPISQSQILIHNVYSN